MKKGKKSVNFAPVFRPVNITVIVSDDGFEYKAMILDVKQDGNNGIVVYVRHK